MSSAYFYPRPPRGGRPNGSRKPGTVMEFLSTPSARRATISTSQYTSTADTISIHALREEGDLVVLFITRIAPKFLSTPSARRATLHILQHIYMFPISIHALREEGDKTHEGRHQTVRNFYPRPPRGGRQDGTFGAWSSISFLSTPSARRATAKTEKNISAFVSL